MKNLFCLGVAILAFNLMPDVFGIYVDTGNPYEPGKLSVSNFFIPTTNGVPKRTMVYHPTQAGDYGVVFFISGLGGYIPSFIYENHLANISSHGYVVVSSMFLVNAGLEGNLNVTKTGEILEGYLDQEEQKMVGDRADVYYKVLLWLQANLQKEIARRVEGVYASFDDMAYSCHSAGCGEIYEIILKNTSLPKAVTFLEPFVKIPALNDFYLPGMLFGTELLPDTCSQAGFDFRQNYDNWACPRVLSSVKDFGHCAILSPFGWEMCRLIRFCTTAPDADLNRYHMFLQGYTSAFYGTYIQGNGDMLKYVTDQSMIPIDFFEFKTDVNC